MADVEDATHAVLRHKQQEAYQQAAELGTVTIVPPEWVIVSAAHQQLQAEVRLSLCMCLMHLLVSVLSACQHIHCAARLLAVLPSYKPAAVGLVESNTLSLHVRASPQLLLCSALMCCVCTTLTFHLFPLQPGPIWPGKEIPGMPEQVKEITLSGISVSVRVCVYGPAPAAVVEDSSQWCRPQLLQTLAVVVPSAVLCTAWRLCVL